MDLVTLGPHTPPCLAAPLGHQKCCSSPSWQRAADTIPGPAPHSALGLKRKYIGHRYNQVGLALQEPCSTSTSPQYDTTGSPPPHQSAELLNQSHNVPECTCTPSLHTPIQNLTTAIGNLPSSSGKSHIGPSRGPESATQDGQEASILLLHFLMSLAATVQAPFITMLGPRLPSEDQFYIGSQYPSSQLLLVCLPEQPRMFPQHHAQIIVTRTNANSSDCPDPVLLAPYPLQTSQKFVHTCPKEATGPDGPRQILFSMAR